MSNGTDMTNTKTRNTDNKVTGLGMSPETDNSRTQDDARRTDVPATKAPDSSYQSKYMQFSGPNILSYDLCKLPQSYRIYLSCKFMVLNPTD